MGRFRKCVNQNIRKTELSYSASQDARRRPLGYICEFPPGRLKYCVSENARQRWLGFTQEDDKTEADRSDQEK